jgi:hypothetical protein
MRMRAVLETRCGCVRSVLINYPPPRCIRIALSTKPNILDFTKEYVHVPLQVRNFVLNCCDYIKHIAYYEEEMT